MTAPKRPNQPSQIDSTDVQTGSGPQSSRSPQADFLSAPQAPDEIGRLGDYRILKLLGEGGMGMVFLAEEVELKRKVALKVMRPEIAAVDIHRQRFLREAQVAAHVEHDYIIPIYRIGQANGVPFITMPLLKGESLEDRLKKQPQLPLTDLMRFGRQIAEGLAAAHRAGLIHRDIKPANVWLESPHDRVRILDFGLARDTSSEAQLTQSGVMMGTPAYMAPEQARGQTIDHRADLFSLGIMLYQMSTGTRPFKGSDVMSLLTSLAVDTPPIPTKMNAELPNRFTQLVMQLLEKDPNRRPQSAETVAELLRSLDLNPSRPAVPATAGWTPKSAAEFDVTLVRDATPSAPKGSKGLLITFVLLLLAGAGAAFWFFTPPKESPKPRPDEIVEAGSPESIRAMPREVDPAKPPTETKPILKESPLDRKVAEWAISVRGQLEIETDKEKKTIAFKESIPPEPFVILELKLTENNLIGSLERLKGLKRITRLQLGGIDLNDNDLATFGTLTSLEILNMAGMTSTTHPTEKGYAELKQLKSLRSLFTGTRPLTNASLKEIAQIPALDVLGIEGELLTPIGLAELKKLKSLRNLNISRLDPTDKMVVTLGELTQLNTLTVRLTRFTAGQERKLETLLKGCAVTYEFAKK